MECEVLGRYLDLYLDGELAVEERAEIEAHLRGCESCRMAATHEARFRTAVRHAMLGVRAPRSLHEQVARRLRSRADEAPRVGMVVAWAASIAVVIGVAFGASTVLGPADPLDDAVAVHAAASGSEVWGDAARVTGFLRERAPFTFRVPIEDREGLRLVGARVTRLGTSPAIVYQYDLGGRRVSVAQYPLSDPARPGGLRMDQRRGYTVATWADSGLEQAVVGDAPEQEVMRIIPASYSGR
ncbi:MAG: zf-HC2 domain-containing protein [Deltaproteobacteria bacterium]|nr:zf-HC2 domain-containing protein [Deltaproteobacteria bacterium]